MDPFYLALAILVGYLSGAVSYARIVARLVDPDRKIGKISVGVPGRKDTFVESDSVSATTIRLQYGGKYGGLVSVLDMLKAAVPTLLFKLWQPDQPYYLAASIMTVVGHNWPIFYRFAGGRGLSCIIGSFLVLNWPGTIATTILGFLIGYRSRNMLLITGGGIVLMIPWILFATGDWIQVAYVLLMNGLYWSSMVPEIKEYARLQRQGTLDEFQDAATLEVIQEDGSVRYDSHTLRNLTDRVDQKLRRDSGSS